MGSHKVIGVTMGWDLKPHLEFEDGKILWGDSDKILYPEYFLSDGSIDYKKIKSEQLKALSKED